MTSFLWQGLAWVTQCGCCFLVLLQRPVPRNCALYYAISTHLAARPGLHQEPVALAGAQMPRVAACLQPLA